MPIIYKYLLTRIAQYFFIVMATVIGIYLAVDFFERIDNFMEASVAFPTALKYFFLKIPFIVSQVCPIAVLLAILIQLGIMNKNNEILALKSSGVSTDFLLKPVIAVGIVSSIVLFLFAEVIVPVTITSANRIWQHKVKKQSAVTLKRDNLWIKGRNYICHIKHYDQVTSTIYGITINYFDDSFKLIKKIDAKKGVYFKDKWKFFNFMEQIIGKDNKPSKINFVDQDYVPINFIPEDLLEIIKKKSDMSIVELYGQIKKIEAEGYDATSYRVDFLAKIAFPFVCLIMSIIGIGISTNDKFNPGVAVNVLTGIGSVFIYWIVYSFCLSLGYGGILPPVVSAFAADLIFITIAIFIILNTN